MYNPRNFCFYSFSATVSFDFETRIMSTCMSTSRSNYTDMSIWKKTCRPQHYTLYMKSAKLFVRKQCQKRAHLKASLCCMKPVHYSKRMLCKQDCVKFCRHIAWQSLFENNFADFSIWCSAGKKKISRFRQAVAGVSN